MIGDTWFAGATWRLPFRNAAPRKFRTGPGIGFEDAVTYRKNQGFNSVSMIACFPNWEVDENANTYADSSRHIVRNAWEKFGYMAEDGKMTSKDMRDESGNQPFEMSDAHKGVADFDKIIPEYFQSLDNKMQYLSEQGFVPLNRECKTGQLPGLESIFRF